MSLSILILTGSLSRSQLKSSFFYNDHISRNYNGLLHRLQCHRGLNHHLNRRCHHDGKRHRARHHRCQSEHDGHYHRRRRRNGGHCKLYFNRRWVHARTNADSSPERQHGRRTVSTRDAGPPAHFHRFREPGFDEVVPMNFIKSLIFVCCI